MGKILGFGVEPYAACDPESKWQEQDPRGLIDAAAASVRNAIARADVTGKKCLGLSIGGALHSILALDERGNPLTGVITWADGRGIHDAETVRRSATAMALYQETGCPVHGMYPLYKLMWLREKRPEVFRRAGRYVTAKEYLFFQFTGEFAVDYCLAAGSGLLNARTLRWSERALELAGIGQEQLSPLHPPVAEQKNLKPEMARRLGISRSTPVIIGSSDAVNSSLGAGAVSASQATCMIGTSGALRVISGHPVFDDKARTWCYAIDEKHWLVGGAINNGGIALSWLKDSLQPFLPADRLPGEISFEYILDLAGRVPAGSDGVICLPFFAGERSPNWNLNARGVFFGLTLEHDIRHLSRSILEGIGYRFMSLRDALAGAGLEIRQILASGGFAKSEIWLQVVADALNREMSVPRWSETSALGAAFWAMVGTGRLDGIDAAGDLVVHGSTCRPIPENAALYDRIYGLYLRIYQALLSAFEEAATLKRETDVRR